MLLISLQGARVISTDFCGEVSGQSLETLSERSLVEDVYGGDCTGDACGGDACSGNICMTYMCGANACSMDACVGFLCGGNACFPHFS